MKTNAQNDVSVPIGRYGKIRIAKSVIRFSAKRVSFQDFLKFNILQTKLYTLYGFQNIIIELDDEDIALNIAFDCEVKGCIRNPKGLLRSIRKKLQYAMSQSYECPYCFDRGCPDCDRRREERREADARDLAAELASRHEWEEAWEPYGEILKNSCCPTCHEPINECQCFP